MTRIILFAAMLTCGLHCARHAVAPAVRGATETHETPLQEDAALMACLDLRDHVVALYTAEYEQQSGESFSYDERVAFTDAWTQELARNGTLDRFLWSCVAGLTREKYTCGMASHDPDELAACMRKLARPR